MELTIKTEIEGINITITKDAVIQLLTTAIKSEKDSEPEEVKKLPRESEEEKEDMEKSGEMKKSFLLDDSISEVVARAKAKTPAAFSAKNTKDDNNGLYKGFLLIRCEDCGSLRGFCAKQPIDRYRCDDCGGITMLQDLRPAYQECECGRSFKYKTNEKSDVITNNCIECGSPVDMMLNAKRTVYTTIR